MQIYADYKTDDLASAMLDNRINVTYNLKVIMTEDYTNPNPKSFPLAEGKVSLQPLEAKGYTFVPETASYHADGSLKNIYLAGEFAGFAIHIIKK